jgi:hypothetical protein
MQLSRAAAVQTAALLQQHLQYRRGWEGFDGKVLPESRKARESSHKCPRIFADALLRVELQRRAEFTGERLEVVRAHGDGKGHPSRGLVQFSEVQGYRRFSSCVTVALNLTIPTSQEPGLAEDSGPEAGLTVGSHVSASSSVSSRGG